MGKKSNHKHEYELVEIKKDEWFTHEKVCKICGHLNNRIRKEVQKEIDSIFENMSDEEFYK